MPQDSNKVVDFDVVKYFLKLLEEDKDLSSGIAAIKTLLMILEKKQFGTIHILHTTMREAVAAMRNTDLSIAAVVSGGELFCRFITLSLDDKHMEECRQIMLHRGKIFLAKLLNSRNVIAQQAQQFITDGCRVLTHSRSRVVLKTLISAAKANKEFHVYVTQGGPDNPGEQMVADLENAGIDSTLILDSAIGYVMESVDFVMVGAEAVVESGGIINRIGSFTMGLCAREMKRPFYVLAESFKFTRLYPLNQRDLPNEYKYSRKDLSDVSKIHPQVDYTPPAYITLLFTDLGILTPSAVSDELIKLYM
ncbi:translation initiation factor eIF-2B subunit alpha-like [Teleopsis dalmanni]|uniref:translation initiation factor eIF-2B subunit alpha-like n=1 Tax=Teleopsis dalmanni TaxID=139649 RepID=UPI0018CEB6EB|nr:translation initiation factor eIF-2B subunit alpha-like [Teleopsis dalmanni]XP_037952946.1 translation initiation factor eIF-2B subunit alpha-like [Teleopsis dalmanni]